MDRPSPARSTYQALIAGLSALGAMAGTIPGSFARAASSDRHEGHGHGGKHTLRLPASILRARRQAERHRRRHSATRRALFLARRHRQFKNRYRHYTQSPFLA